MKLTKLLANDRCPDWVKDAAYAAISQKDLIDAANNAEFLAQAIREWALSKMGLIADTGPR